MRNMENQTKPTQNLTIPVDNIPRMSRIYNACKAENERAKLVTHFCLMLKLCQWTVEM